METFRSECTRILSKIRPSATFLTATHYVNNHGEQSNFSICFHINYLNSINRAKELLELFNPQYKHCIGKPYTVDHLRVAKSELLDSFAMTLDGYNPLATSAHAYDEIVGADGKVIPGIKLHRNQDIVHLWGFKLHKKILMPGSYPKDNRSLRTLAKDDLRDLSPLGAFVQFKLTPGKFYKLVVEKMTIKEEDVIRETYSRLIKKG